MKYLDVKEKFLSGSKLNKVFGIRNMFHYIDDIKINQKTYDKIIMEYKDNSSTFIDTSGLTKHVTIYNKS